MIDGVYLQCTSSGHHKHYYVCMNQQANGCGVLTAWGKIDGMYMQSFNGAHSSEYGARAVFNRIVREKVAKGYVVCWRPGMTGRTWKQFAMALPMVHTPAWFIDPPSSQSRSKNGKIIAAATAMVTAGVMEDPPVMKEKRKTDAGSGSEKKEKSEKKSKLRRPDADWNF